MSAVIEICPWFNMYCQMNPRSRLVEDVFFQIAHHTLKRNMVGDWCTTFLVVNFCHVQDFGKFPCARLFVQNFLLALAAQNNGHKGVSDFVDRQCPHPRVLPNLVNICLSAIQSVFDDDDHDDHDANKAPRTIDHRRLHCYCSVIDALSVHDDWRPSLASILQPIPFPYLALINLTFNEQLSLVMARIGTDSRCEVHRMVLGVRDGKDGWFQLYCLGGSSCVDDGQLYAHMLNSLLSCCCKRKRFLQNLVSMLGPLQLLALRENDSAMQALCSMLELEVVEGEDLKLQMITALQSTISGRRYYTDLCERLIALRELQQKGGPRKLTLPSRSTDNDLAVMLSSGSFGNLEWLSLAFTNVTSACAELLVKLPSLRHLDLWSTQFGDLGVQLLSENLTKLQVLNLCETPVSDQGLASLASLKNLHKLNMNSTKLSAETFQNIRTNLPYLQEVDICYTEAWCAGNLPILPTIKPRNDTTN